jgi:Na+/H+ antiporter NhaD/arsenite permease-like protein
MNAALATAIFAVSYALLTKSHTPFLPLGRTGVAFVGATLMVASGALSAEAAREALDVPTLLLLFAMMGLGVCFREAGLFSGVERLLGTPRLTPRLLLHVLVALAGVLSAFLINDTVCVFLTPIVCTVCVQRRLPLGPYLLAVATSANIGSAATLVGNPQNMLIGNLGPLGFGAFARSVGPAALLGLVLNALLLELFFGRTLGALGAAAPDGPAPTARAGARGLWVLGLVVAGFFAVDDVVLVSLAGLALALVLERREPSFVWRDLDFPLLVFFGGLFVLVAGFRATGLPEQAFTALAPLVDLSTASGVGVFSTAVLIGSNLFSNVPLVALLGPWLRDRPDAAAGFALLGFVSTVAGNLTLLGSVANLIVAERARAHYDLGFWEYARFGVVSTLAVLALGIPVVYWCTAGR